MEENDEVGTPRRADVSSLLGRIEGDLDDVDRALRRIDEGVYGRCEVCDEPLGDGQLEADPVARWCPDHASTPPGPRP